MSIRMLKAVNWRQLLIAVLVVFAGFLLRVHALEDLHLWHDETDWFDEQMYGDKTMSLRRYAALKAQEHTVGPAWPIVVGLSCQVLGGTATSARMPSVLLGTATIAAVFGLVYRVVQTGSRRKPFLPALLAASLTAMSAVQIVYSQGAYPFVALACLSALLFVLHIEIVSAIRSADFPLGRFLSLAVLYALVAGTAAYVHLSFVVVFFASFCGFLGVGRRLAEWDRPRRIIVPAVGVLVALGVFWALCGHYLHLSQSPYRYYLAPYYHAPKLSALGFLPIRVYDLLVYHLNLFYSGAWYWPRRLNPVLLPLVGLCLLGWISAAVGRFGRPAKHLSLLAVTCLALLALMSLARKHPLGGVRQTLFMAPLLFAFTGMGFSELARWRIGKPVAAVVAAAYLAVWAMNLPHLYADRITAFEAKDIREAWEQNGRLKIYADGNCQHELRYRMGRDSAVTIEPLSLPLPDEREFLLVSTIWPLEDSLFCPTLRDTIHRLGYDVTPIKVRASKYRADPDYIQSLYYPPNGLWIYRVAANDRQENNSTHAH